MKSCVLFTAYASGHWVILLAQPGCSDEEQCLALGSVRAQDAAELQVSDSIHVHVWIPKHCTKDLMRL